MAIPLKKENNLPELPETLRMVPLNPEKTLYKAVPDEPEQEEPRIPEPPQEPEETEEEPIEEVTPEELPQQVPQIDGQTLFLNHEQRLIRLEAALFRAGVI